MDTSSILRHAVWGSGEDKIIGKEGGSSLLLNLFFSTSVSVVESYEVRIRTGH